jgi:hypothetical protein
MMERFPRQPPSTQLWFVFIFTVVFVFYSVRASVGERRTNAIVVAIPSNVRDRILKDAEEQAC